MFYTCGPNEAMVVSGKNPSHSTIINTQVMSYMILMCASICNTEQ